MIWKGRYLLLVLLAQAAGGCAHRARLNAYDRRSGYRFERLTANGAAQSPKNSDVVFVMLALSGGGTRAAALSTGVLNELKATTFHLNPSSGEPCAPKEFRVENGPLDDVALLDRGVLAEEHRHRRCLLPDLGSFDVAANRWLPAEARSAARARPTRPRTASTSDYVGMRCILASSAQLPIEIVVLRLSRRWAISPPQCGEFPFGRVRPCGEKNLCKTHAARRWRSRRLRPRVPGSYSAALRGAFFRWSATGRNRRPCNRTAI
jgi:hypothetical protein